MHKVVATTTSHARWPVAMRRTCSPYCYSTPYGDLTYWKALPGMPDTAGVRARAKRIDFGSGIVMVVSLDSIFAMHGETKAPDDQTVLEDHLELRKLIV